MSCNGNYRFNENLYGHTPAPVKLIRFTSPEFHDRSIDEETLIDSGASGTLISKNIVDQLALEETDRVESFDFEENSTGFKPIYIVQVSCDSFSFDIDAMETNSHPILGRNVLNQLELLLRGRNQTWEMR